MVCFSALADEVFPEFEGFFYLDAVADGHGEISVVFPVGDALAGYSEGTRKFREVAVVSQGG